LAHALAVAVYAACGVYQFSPLKDRCVKHCRSPLGLLAVGVMNLGDGGAGRLRARGEDVPGGPLAGRVAGVAALGLAVATIWAPGLAPVLHAAAAMPM
jgi:Predicted metal-binding integral membrane protein (DUF2182)